VFDWVYFGFAAAIAGLLVTTIAGAIRRAFVPPVLIALGYLEILVAGVGLNELARSIQLENTVYFRLVFPCFYLGLGLILFGSQCARTGGNRYSVWITYGAACAIAGIFLFSPSLTAYVRTSEGSAASQQVVFYLPFFVGTALVAIDAVRTPRWPLAVFGLFIFLGNVRESGTISLGDPYVNLLAAFVPFTLAALVLALWTFRVSLSHDRASRRRDSSV
jgi:hypothetical protein